MDGKFFQFKNKLLTYKDDNVEKFTNWCLKKGNKIDKFIKVINGLYLFFNSIFLGVLIFIDFYKLYNDKSFIEFYSLIFPYILISFICIYLPIYFLLELGRTNDIFPKTYLFVFCIQLIEIVFYILLFVEHFRHCININLYLSMIIIIIIFKLIQVFLWFYNKEQKSQFSINKWFKSDYPGYGYKMKEDLREIICKDGIFKNHFKLKDIELKILNKFKTRENLIREKFLVSKKLYFFVNFKLIDITLVIFGLSFSLISPIVNLITATYRTESIKILKNKFISIFDNGTVVIIILFLLFPVMFKIYDYFLYKDKKRYVYLLDYVINNYKILSEKYNIKRLCLRDEFFNKYYLTTIFIEYSNKLIKQEELKDTIKFLEENGIQIIFCSNEIERKDIEKCLKNYNLFSYDYTIIDKKEIEKIKIEKNMKDTGVNNEFYQILSEKLGISTNEKFIISESEEEIKLEFVDFEDKYFSDLKEVLEFLESKME